MDWSWLTVIAYMAVVGILVLCMTNRRNEDMDYSFKQDYTIPSRDDDAELTALRDQLRALVSKEKEIQEQQERANLKSKIRAEIRVRGDVPCR